MNNHQPPPPQDPPFRPCREWSYERSDGTLGCVLGCSRFADCPDAKAEATAAKEES